MSLVTTATEYFGYNTWLRRSTRAVLPEPTGPATPMRKGRFGLVIGSPLFIRALSLTLSHRFFDFVSRMCGVLFFGPNTHGQCGRVVNPRPYARAFTIRWIGMGRSFACAHLGRSEPAPLRRNGNGDGK